MDNKKSLEDITKSLVDLALDLTDTLISSKTIEDMDLPNMALKSTLENLKKLYDLGVPVYGEEVVKVEEDINVTENKKDVKAKTKKVGEK